MLKFRSKSMTPGIQRVVDSGFSHCYKFSVFHVNVFLLDASSGLRFSRCEICTHLSGQINDRSTPMEEKLGSIKTYREHLHDQYVDRSVQWTLSELSADPDSGVLTVLVDGMDQAKFRLPKHPQHRAIASMQAGFQVKSFFFQYITVDKFHKKFIIIIDVVLVCATKAYPRATVIRPCLKLHAAWAVGCSSTFGNYFNPL